MPMALESKRPNTGSIAPLAAAAVHPNRRIGVSGLWRWSRRLSTFFPDFASSTPLVSCSCNENVCEFLLLPPCEECLLTDLSKDGLLLLCGLIEFAVLDAVCGLLESTA